MLNEAKNAAPAGVIGVLTRADGTAVHVCSHHLFSTMRQDDRFESIPAIERTDADACALCEAQLVQGPDTGDEAGRLRAPWTPSMSSEAMSRDPSSVDAGALARERTATAQAHPRVRTGTELNADPVERGA